MRTPYHIFDERQYERNLILLKQISQETGCKFLLALKGYIPFHSVELTEKYLDGISTSSVYEHRASHTYFPKLSKHYYAPATSEEDMKAIIDMEPEVIVLNSHQQLEHHQNKIPHYIGIDLRLNLQHVISDANVFEGYDPNRPFSRFGVTQSELQEDKLERVSGIHIHVLNSQGAKDLEAMVAILEKKFHKLLHQVTRLNLGGGHTITKEDYDIDRLKKIMIRLKETYNLEIYLEPSEHVFHNCGVLKTKVLSIMYNDINIAIVDTSAKNHMPDILESPDYSVEFKEGELNNNKPHYYRVGGCTCLTGDIIGQYSFEKPLKEGDILTIQNQTAYTTTQATWFNGIRKPGLEVIGTDGTLKLSVEDSYEDYMTSMRM
ncbi:MAG: carboxynorspermidine decarboxylase [Alphaproteobacteria bacterium]|nr:carboxynorspermidine decarboxylase [Alphaproteobacteria bacterium]